MNDTLGLNAQNLETLSIFGFQLECRRSPRTAIECRRLNSDKSSRSSFDRNGQFRLTCDDKRNSFVLKFYISIWRCDLNVNSKRIMWRNDRFRNKFQRDAAA